MFYRELAVVRRLAMVAWEVWIQIGTFFLGVGSWGFERTFSCLSLTVVFIYSSLQPIINVLMFFPHYFLPFEVASTGWLLACCMNWFRGHQDFLLCQSWLVVFNGSITPMLPLNINDVSEKYLVLALPMGNRADSSALCNYHWCGCKRPLMRMSPIPSKYTRVFITQSGYKKGFSSSSAAPSVG